jgi:hypothetical protein
LNGQKYRDQTERIAACEGSALRYSLRRSDSDAQPSGSSASPYPSTSINSLMASEMRTTLPARGRRASWFVLVVGLTFAVPGAISLWTALDVSLRGVPTTAKVIEHHGEGGGRGASIAAKVEVTSADMKALRTEVHDDLGLAEWVDGGTMNLMCTKLVSGHPYCELDSWLDRWVLPMGFFVIGAAAVWWWWRTRG